MRALSCCLVAITIVPLVGCSDDSAESDGGSADADASLDARIDLTRYEGYVAILPTVVDVMIWAPGDGCHCPLDAPRFGQCHLWCDASPGCGWNDGCEPCVESVTLRSAGNEDRVFWWSGGSGPRVNTRHELTTDDVLTVIVEGCLGTIEVSMTVPAPVAVSVLAPEPVGARQTRLRWNSAPPGDEVLLVAGDLFGWECRAADTGEFLMELSEADVGVVVVEPRYKVGQLDAANASISLFEGSIGSWDASAAVSESALPGSTQNPRGVGVLSHCFFSP